MTNFAIDRADRTRVPHRQSRRRSPRPLTVVVIATLLFFAPGRSMGTAISAGGPGGGGHGGGARGGFNGGHMGGGQAGHGHLGEHRSGRPDGAFRGHDFDRRSHDFHDGLGFYIFPGAPYYDYEPYQPYVYDPDC